MEKVVKWFVPSAGLVFLITGVAKIWSAGGHARILQHVDPLFNIQFRYLMLFAGIAELIIAGICLFARPKSIGALSVAWLATSLLIYRMGLFWIGWHRPCLCLGNLTDSLRISPQLADSAMMVILGYLLIGSYGTSFWLWRQANRSPVTVASAS